MCSPRTEIAIATVVTELVSQRKTFTGRDVHTRMHNKHIRRTDNFSDCTEGSREISQEVRRMFNGKHAAFVGYGSAIVNHRNGPVIYFALPHHAKSFARKIATALETPKTA